LRFVGLHLLLVLKLGINEWPMPGRIVRRATYVKEYHELTQKDGIPFVPGAIAKDMFFSGFILLAIAACACAHFGPFGPSGQPDPTIIQTAPAGLLFPVALCGAVAAAAVDGNSGAADRTGDRAWRASGAAVFFGRRREELEAPSHRGSYDSAGRGLARHVHASGRQCALESGDGRVERRTDSAQYLKGRTALERQGRSFFKPSSATTATLWAAREESAGRRWIESPFSSRRINSSAR
jgi:hypothetical protein